MRSGGKLGLSETTLSPQHPQRRRWMGEFRPMAIRLHDADDAVQNAFGRIANPESPAPLFVRTGLDDDHRRPLDRVHPLYRVALYALEWQDRWSDDQHKDFWTALIAQWPRERGQRKLRETMGWAAHELRRYGLDDAAIAEVLCVEEDTLRRRDIFAAGDMVFREQIELPRDLLAKRGPPPPLPRVYSDAGDPPVFSWVNLPPGVRPRPPAILVLERKVLAKLGELRQADEVRQRGSE